MERLIASAGEKAGASATPEAHTSVRRSRLARRWLAFLFFIVGLIAAFANPLASLAIHAAFSDLHSHVLLIPFVSAYLIYNRRNHLPKEYDSSPGWAVVLLLVGVAALIAAWGGRVFGEPLTHNDYLALTTLSFICLLIAGGFFFLGRKWMVATAFPFAFLIFMVPMPDAMSDILETASKLASAEAANLFFHLSGTPVFRYGTVFQLPNITIQVAQECSGIRSSWVLFITSLLAGNLFLKSNWRRVLLICFVLPLAILRNGFRVCVIGMLCVSFGPQMINSIIHRRGGPLFFALSLIPLFFLLWWLRRGEVVISQAE